MCQYLASPADDVLCRNNNGAKVNRARIYRRDMLGEKSFNLQTKAGPMSDRLATLTTARERMIEDRDQFAKTLAGPPDRDKSERARAKFLELQTLIDAIDRAIESERGAAQTAQSAAAVDVR
jgi:hypothetical protein